MTGSKERYKELVKQQAVPLFFQPQWLDRTGVDWDVVITEADGRIQAVWVYAIEKKLGFTLIRNPLLTPYLGPLFFFPESHSEKKRLQEEEKYFDRLVRQLPQWDLFEVQCFPGFDHFLLFHQHQMAHSRRITYFINLEPDEAVLWERIGGKQRYAIRQAEKDLKVVDGFVYAKQLYTLHRETLRSKGKKYPYSERFFNELFESTQRNGSSYTRAALTDTGEIAAIIFTVFDANSMYLLLTANNKHARHNGGVALLIWDAIRQGKQKGLTIFDFEGSMDKGIEQFFRSFGGERKTYLQARSVKSRWWKLKEWLTSS